MHSRAKNLDEFRKAYTGACLLYDNGDIEGAKIRLERVLPEFLEALGTSGKSPAAFPGTKSVLDEVSSVLSSDPLTPAEIEDALFAYRRGLFLLGSRRLKAKTSWPYLRQLFFYLTDSGAVKIRLRADRLGRWLKRREKILAASFGGLVLVAAGITSVYHYQNRKYGLEGEYFLNSNLTKSYFKKRDKMINFNWGSYGISGKYRNWFSVRWSGFLLAPKAGLYEFRLNSDDGARLFIGEKLVIDAWEWEEHHLRDTFGYIDLAQGAHPITIEYHEDRGHASIRLSWRQPGQRDFTLIDEKFFFINAPSHL